MAFTSTMQTTANKIAENYENAASYLQERHDATIANASALKAKLAELPLNEAESEWRNGIMNQIDAELNAVDIEGFKGYGLNNIVKMTGDIVSSPAMLGRLQAQKDFTAFQDEIKARKDLTELDKEYFLTHNPYHYEDTYNDKGQVVSGTKWLPAERALTRVDFNDILDKARQWAAPDSSAYDTMKFVDENGNETSDTSAIANAYYFDTISGETKWLSKDKIKEAIDAAINSTPGAHESLAQEYKIAVWAAENKGINDGVIGKDGMPISQEEYLALRTNPFIDAVSYKHTKYGNKISVNELAKARLNAVGTSNPSTGGYSGYNDMFDRASMQTTRGGVKQINTIEYNALMDTARNAMKELDTIIDKNHKIDYNDTKSNMINQVNAMMKDGTISEDDYDRIMYDIDAIDAFNSRKKFMFKDAKGIDKERNNFVTNYLSGNEITEEECGDIGRRYNKKLKNVWQEQNNTVASYLSATVSKEQYDKFMYELGGEDKARALGITLGSNQRGDFTIVLPYNYKENTGTYLLNLSKFGYNNINRLDENGNIIKDRVTDRFGRDVYQDMVQFLERQIRKNDEYVNEHPVYSEITVLPFGSIEEGTAKNNAMNNPKDVDKYLKIASMHQNDAVKLWVGSGDFTQYHMQIWDEDKKQYRDCTDKDIKTLNEQVNYVNQVGTNDKKKYNYNAQLARDSFGNIYELMEVSDGSGKTFKYLKPDDGSSKYARDYARQDETIARNQIGTAKTYKTNIDIYNSNGYNIKYDDNKFALFKGNDSFLNILKEEDVMAITTASVQLNKLMNRVNAGLSIDPQQYVIAARKLADIYGFYGIANGNALFNELLEQFGIEVSE